MVQVIDYNETFATIKMPTTWATELFALKKINIQLDDSYPLPDEAAIIQESQSWLKSDFTKADSFFAERKKQLANL